MSRHIERAENTARLLDVTYRMSLLPYEPIEPGLAWAEPGDLLLVLVHIQREAVQRFLAAAVVGAGLGRS